MEVSILYKPTQYKMLKNSASVYNVINCPSKDNEYLKIYSTRLPVIIKLTNNLLMELFRRD